MLVIPCVYIDKTEEESGLILTWTLFLRALYPLLLTREFLFVYRCRRLHREVESTIVKVVNS